MQAFYADQFVLPLPDGHRFPMGKYALLRDALACEQPGVQMRPAPAATDGELALAHDPDYIDAVANGSLSPALVREIGFPWSPQMNERARRSVGATVAACRAALGLRQQPRQTQQTLQPGGSHRMRQGLAANLAGGTHHASASKGGGFCVFNDSAVAARLMQAEMGVGLRVAIIDLDVHQGNGTASIFKGDRSVYTLSLHGAKNFPFRKEPSTADVELPDGCGDFEYLAALHLALEDLDNNFDPGLVIYLAGADPHEGDRLGRLKLTFDGLQARDRAVFDWAWQKRVPVAFSMAGGYGRDIRTTLAVQRNTFAVALAYWQRWQNLGDS